MINANKLYNCSKAKPISKQRVSHNFFNLLCDILDPDLAGKRQHPAVKVVNAAMVTGAAMLEMLCLTLCTLSEWPDNLYMML